MLPPQAPPAQIQTIHQEARQAFDRVVGLRQWLAAEHAALPALPEPPTADNLPNVLADLDAYWRAAPTNPADGASRRAALASRLAAAAHDLAVLAHQDGHMDENTRGLVRTLTTATGGLPSHVVVREATFNGTPYAGVLLLRDTNAGDAVWMFSTDRGWEPFDNLAVALARLETRARLALVSSADLPGLARQQAASLGVASSVDSRPLSDAPFTVFVDRLIDMQRAKLEQAWFEFRLAKDDASRVTRLGDAVSDILDGDRIFDVAGVLAARQANLAESANEQRLARVPAYVADDWREARDGYLSTLRAQAARPSNETPAAVKGLAEFTRDALRGRLRPLGVTLDPADIDVDVQNTSGVLDFLVGTPPSLNLVDLAYRNIGSNDPVRLNAVDRQGSTVAALGDATLRQMIRELDIHRRYLAYLDAELRTGALAATRRDHATVLRQAEMRFLANEARLANFLDDEPRSFRRDRMERGFRWVEAVLDAPVASRRARVETHPIVASQITYQGVAVRDILLIGVREPRSAPTVVLYTPHAPDGVSFREFHSRADAAREFLYNPRFREYLLDRLPVEHATVRANGSREFAGDRLANWVLGSPSSAGYTQTAERFEERKIDGDVFAALYEAEVQLAQRNARTLTTGSDDAQSRWKEEFDRKTLASVARVIRDVVTAPIQSAAAGWRLYDSVKAGDTTQGFVDFTHFYVASLWAAPGIHSFGKAALGRGIGATTRFRAAGRLIEASVQPPQPTAFETRYLARGIRKSGSADHDGIFTIDGKSYIEQAGKMYGVRYDEGFETWRLMKPNASPSAWGPAIRRTADDGWALHHVGLRGGSGRGNPNTTSRPMDLFDDYSDELVTTFPDPMELDIVNTRMLREFHHHIAADVTDAQRMRWHEAFGRAQSRAAARRAAQTTYPRSVAMDLTNPPPPAGLRRVPREELPETLYFYDRLPFRDSRLERPLTQGYSTRWASIRTSLVAENLHGVRVTSVAPTAASDVIENAMGLPGYSLPRSSTFAVEFNTPHMMELAPHLPRPSMEAFAPIGGPEGTYFLVPSDGSNQLRLSTFLVQKRLPPR